MEQPGSTKLWGFLIGMFWVSLVTYFVLWRSYRRIVLLRIRQQKSAIARPHEFTVLVKDLPKPTVHETQSDQVDSFFRMVHPGAYDRCIVVNDLRKVRLVLIRLHVMLTARSYSLLWLV